MSNCHDVYSHSEDYVLDPYSAISSKGINPGNGVDSNFYDDPGDRMHQQSNDPLTASQIAVIKSWIISGAPNN